MKILFVGPTLPDAAEISDPGITLRPPAQKGDIVKALEDGVNAIGLIDGFFENVAPVWHKEILFALSRGVHIYGAASMGALRAAECAAFGMIGVGRIFEAYASGALADDSAVAQIHAPAELGYRPLSEPLVNVQATLQALAETGAIGEPERAALQACAETMFFKSLTYRSVAEAADLPDPARRPAIADLLRANTVNQKRSDALQLLRALADCPDERRQPPRDWTFQTNSLWHSAFHHLEIAL
ncbi:antibiotic resistance protein [Rhizobium lusitanum]|uniref:TfuA-like protein n=1 Tax=Rhizobium lusitanum TaxID=293958 RepID=UPI001610645C|nr:TfuA-like protein [Rhizobium lusitanum]QND48747.1 antibiotic resistance protein [Rhizobium lusitanum]